MGSALNMTTATLEKLSALSISGEQGLYHVDLIKGKCNNNYRYCSKKLLHEKI
jgi:hypothetical protein